jgi:hypothetical protein
MKNNIRFDLSDYLIHFFRDVDLEGKSSIIFPEDMGWQNLHEDFFLPAFFLLRAALRNGRLWATWSFRNEIRTIYGPSPAICFTEMPISAFLEAGTARHAQGQAMSPFGIVFPKRTLYLSGARPVISGLSGDVHASVSILASGERMLPESVLHPLEQYRYVTFNLDGLKNIDWTHEREWRLPFRTDYSDVNSQVEECGIVARWDEIPGLDFYKCGIQGMGVIVKTKDQADLIIRDMLTLVDSGQASYETFGFVLASSLLPAPTQLREPAIIANTIASAMINLEPHFALSEQLCREYNKRFSELVKQVESAAGEPNYGEFGGCWLWLHDNSSSLTRALLRTNRAFVTKDGRYLASLYEFSDSRNLKDREVMTSNLAKLVRAEFEASCGYFSVLGSDDPSGVPFYAADFDDDISFFNCSWNVKE